MAWEGWQVGRQGNHASVQQNRQRWAGEACLKRSRPPAVRPVPSASARYNTQRRRGGSSSGARDAR